MVDALKNERFRAQFLAWRGVNIAGEEDYLAAAILISNYTEQKKLTDIQKGLASANSPDYISLGQKRLQGALLFAKLAVEDYRNWGISREEKALLAVIATDLGHLYTDPTNAPKTRLDNVSTNISLWLERFALNSKNKTQAKNLCHSLYTALKITELRNRTLDDALKNILKTSYGINVNEMQATLQILLDKIADVSTNLEELLRRQEEDILLELSPLIKHFNGSYLDIFQADLSEEEKLEQLHQMLAEDETNLSRLITFRENQVKLDKQLRHASLLLGAFEENESLTTNRKYALELVTTHRVSYDNLIKHSAPEVRRRWEERLANFEHPDPLRKITSGVQYGISTLAFLPIIAFRAWAPKTVQETVRQYAPATADSQFKEELMALSRERQLDLNKRLQAIENGITTVTASLTERRAAKEEMLSLLVNMSSPALKRLHASTSTLKAMVKEYQELRAIMLRNQQKLNDIKALDQHIDAFVAKHNDFFVWLSNLFAKISSIFKTDTARKIDEVLDIKHELQLLKQQYEDEINRKHANITDNFQIAEEIKEDLETLLPASEPAPPAGLRVYQVDNIHHSFSRIKQQRQQITDTEDMLSPSMLTSTMSV